ncbi:hypothetical protein TL16_g09777 [Triparma laevis f. inornata]|uniref:Uncharacterized protein n=1 Tax=Triparma laevis f. inornata TaxID=1714386 RepID=A0A9W7B8G5_9STRA|nr:hypothetical protein TL16_g09777 [Triparma laevis f. inornata]
MRIYINGVLKVEETDGYVPLKLQRNLHYLGRAIGSTNGYFHGQISYLNIYNTKELSSNEVLEFYNKRNGEMPLSVADVNTDKITLDARGPDVNFFTFSYYIGSPAQDIECQFGTGSYTTTLNQDAYITYHSSTAVPTNYPITNIYYGIGEEIQTASTRFAYDIAGIIPDSRVQYNQTLLVGNSEYEDCIFGMGPMGALYTFPEQMTTGLPPDVSTSNFVGNEFQAPGSSFTIETPLFNWTTWYADPNPGSNLDNAAFNETSTVIWYPTPALTPDPITYCSTWSSTMRIGDWDKISTPVIVDSGTSSIFATDTQANEMAYKLAEFWKNLAPGNSLEPFGITKLNAFDKVCGTTGYPWQFQLANCSSFEDQLYLLNDIQIPIYSPDSEEAIAYIYGSSLLYPSKGGRNCHCAFEP